MLCIGTMNAKVNRKYTLTFALKYIICTQASGGTALVILNCCTYIYFSFFTHKIIVQNITKIKMKPERKRHTHDI